MKYLIPVPYAALRRMSYRHVWRSSDCPSNVSHLVPTPWISKRTS